ncbi:hypothetical protein [Mycolicibacterium farcinogenes]|uniref:Uncharacterized protein n=1 Tax=Mycolicibacterium farcinogenes TaxID=1802 RepID=A0ACD1FI60_MYCFR|nr:hypothetical protein [Mycolicibacterium farcinogenes]QZH66736.1 hypothetical protein K6L26_03320 [Mycolicibacterium farcinogenes]
MRIDYRDLITNLHSGVHSDMDSAQTRLRGVVELLEQAPGTVPGGGRLTDTVADLRAVERRLAELVRR